MLHAGHVCDVDNIIKLSIYIKFSEHMHER